MSETVKQPSLERDEPKVPTQAAPSISVPETRDVPAAAITPIGTAEGGEDAPKISKNALKRLRKQQAWEDGREDRAKRRKEKRHERRNRWKEAREAGDLSAPPSSHRPRPHKSTQVPVALVLDCDFESYMTEKELISLSSQVTRSYSDNRGARYRSHLWIGGWQGKLRERFETTMRNSHTGWKGVGFSEGNFVTCCHEATKKMEEASETAGELIEPLQRSRDHPVEWTRDDEDPFPLPDPEPEPKEEDKNIVYLTSESPYTLERLEANTCYVIGGIVDKNRQKGLCYRRARERGIRTAKLPIGKFMMMQSRQVLATNHVVEIMLKWLEFEDWGKAFTAVIPKRKGGTLRENSLLENSIVSEEEAEEEEDTADFDEAYAANNEASVAPLEEESKQELPAEK